MTTNNHQKPIIIQSLLYNTNKEYVKIKNQRKICCEWFVTETFRIGLVILIESKY